MNSFQPAEETQVDQRKDGDANTREEEVGLK
jgi:hypothetical protein